MRRPRCQQLLFSINQIRGIECCDLKTVTVRDGVGGASLHAISAKNTAVVVDVVDLGVALGAADPVLVRILGGLNIDAIGWTIGGAQEAGHALLQPIFVPLQDVHAAIPLLKLRSPQRPRAVGIVLYNRWLKHLPKGNAHSLGDGGDILDDRHTLSSIAKRPEQANPPRGESCICLKLAGALPSRRRSRP
jgi:hypothetical protein